MECAIPGKYTIKKFSTLKNTIKKFKYTIDCLFLRIRIVSHLSILIPNQNYNLSRGVGLLYKSLQLGAFCVYTT